VTQDSGTIDPGNFCFERVVLKKTRYDNIQTFVYMNTGSKDLYQCFRTSDAAVVYTAGSYRGHDWFSLMSQFDEACNSFITSKFMLGEDIKENDIFVDAIKSVINPSHAIRTLLKGIVSHVKHYRGKTLGQAASILSKGGANAYLSYNLGIKPAISDIKAVLDAHSNVASRMDYFNQNAGEFIPIRVKQSLDSDVSNTPPTRTSDWQKYITCESKNTTATIGCYGRVRQDLNFADTWSAYLQYFGINKIVGLAWELIPCSFMVDWIFNARERINYYTRLNTGGPFTEFRGMCSSEKTQLTELLVMAPGFETFSPTDPFAVAKQVTTEYKRLLDIPDTSGVITTQALGLFHLITSGSIILQRLL
jgi:hypothetical protein